MESESKHTLWNVDATDFVPLGLSSFAPKPQPSKKPKDQHKNNKKKSHPMEERKLNTKGKDCVTLSVIGPSQSGKSSVAELLVGNSLSSATTTYRVLQGEGKLRKYSVLDGSGSTKDQIVPICHADHVILVLSVQGHGAEYLKEIAMVLKNYTIGRVLVAISHLEEIRWDSTSYSAVVQGIRQVFDKEGVRDTIFIPISSGVNVVQRVGKDLAPWYNGKSLLQAVETLEPPQKKLGKGLRMCLLPTQNDSNYNFFGRILTGTLTLQSKVVLMPQSLRVDILSIADPKNNPIDQGNTGEIVKLLIRLPEPNTSPLGLILCENQEKCVTSKEFRAEVTWLNLGNTMVTSGFVGNLLLHSGEENAEITEVLNVVDLKTKAKIKIHQVGNDQKAVVIVRAENMVCAENISKGCDCLGKFSIAQGGNIVGVGRILELHNKVEEVASQMGF